MRLSRTARQEVQHIASHLPDNELERISAEVDARMSQHKTNPLTPALCDYLARHYDRPAIELFGEDDDQHEAVERLLRDVLVKVSGWEVAIAIWKNKNSFDEVA